jgi:hypothetical protein
MGGRNRKPQFRPNEAPATLRSGTRAGALASLKTGWKRRRGTIWGDPVNDKASVGTDGVGSGCTRPWGCSMATVSITPLAESAASMIGHINFDRNPTEKRSAGKPPATFDAAGTGDVAWLRYGGTRRRKGEQQRTQTSTYTRAPVLDPTCNLLGVQFPRAHLPGHPLRRRTAARSIGRDRALKMGRHAYRDGE